MKNPIPTDGEKRAVMEAFRAGRPVRVPLNWGCNSRVVVLNPAWNPEGVTYEQMLREPEACFAMQARFDRFCAEELSLSSDHVAELPERWTFSVEWHNTYDGQYFGGQPSFHDGQVPDVAPFLGLDDVDDFLRRDFSRPLENPFIRRTLAYREELLAAAEGFRHLGRAGEVVPFVVVFDGPLTVGTILFGPDIFLLLAEEPEKARELLLHITRAAILRTRALRRIAGRPERDEWASLADDSIQLIGHDLLEEVVLPAMELWYEEMGTAPREARRRGIHLCGDATRHFPFLSERLGVNAFDTGFPVDHGRLRRELGPEVTITGGPPVELLLGGTPARCYAAARDILRSGVKEGGRFGMREGNNLPPLVPRENLQAVYDAVLDEGGYDGTGARSVKPAAPLNVLFLISDQHRFDALGCAGHPVVRTPNLDRLAASSVRFERAYAASPLCGPCRSALVTGRHVHRCGTLTHGHMRRDMGLPLLGELFRGAGYATAAFGKVHVAGETDGNDLGFDERALRIYTPMANDYQHTIGLENFYKYASYLPKYRPPDAPPPRNGINPANAPIELEEELILDRMVADRSIDFLERRGDAPFFLWVGLEKPHNEMYAPKRFHDLYDPDTIELPPDLAQPRDGFPDTIADNPEFPVLTPGAYTDRELRCAMAAYYANVSYMDEQAGRVLDALDRLGLAGRTLVVYTSDHGENLFNHGMVQKHCFFDTAVRVPLMVRRPAEPAAGAVRPQLAGLVDLFPTFADACGLAAPDGLDGRSLRPFLDDPAAPGPDAVFSEYYSAGTAERMIRTGRWKYVHSEGDRHQLYDLENDPGELTNLAADPAFAATARELDARVCGGWAMPDLAGRAAAARATRGPGSGTVRVQPPPRGRKKGRREHEALSGAIRSRHAKQGRSDMTSDQHEKRRASGGTLGRPPLERRIRPPFGPLRAVSDPICYITYWPQIG